MLLVLETIVGGPLFVGLGLVLGQTLCLASTRGGALPWNLHTHPPLFNILTLDSKMFWSSFFGKFCVGMWLLSVGRLCMGKWKNSKPDEKRIWKKPSFKMLQFHRTTKPLILHQHSLDTMPEDNGAAATNGNGVTLLDLPPDLVPKIATCLDVGINSDLTNLCVVGGREMANDIRFEYLKDNEEYLRHTIVSHPTTLAKAKLMQWMEVNNNWKKRCDPSKIGQRLSRFIVPKAAIYRLYLQELRPGIVSFRSYAGSAHGVELPSKGDPLLFIENKDVTGMKLDRVNRELHRFLWGNQDVKLIFMSSTDFVFNHPQAAIRMGLTPVMKHMVDKEYIRANDKCESLCNIFPKPILHHSLTLSPDASCFEYLLSLPDIDPSFDINGKSLIQICVESRRFFSVSALAALLQHPRGAPDVNATNSSVTLSSTIPVCISWTVMPTQPS